MKNECGGVVNVCELVVVFRIMLREHDLETGGDTIPKGVGKASFEASTLFALGDAIFLDEEGRHGVILTIVVAKVVESVDTLSSEASDEQVEVIHGELPVTVRRGVKRLNCCFEIDIGFVLVRERRKRRPNVFFSD